MCEDATGAEGGRIVTGIVGGVGAAGDFQLRERYNGEVFSIRCDSKLYSSIARGVLAMSLYCSKFWRRYLEVKLPLHA